MNALGIDVSTLDVEAFLAAGRQWFPLLALLWIAASLKVKQPLWLLGGVVLANAWVFGVTTYPLRQIYALSMGHDRLLNIGLVQMVAAGHSPAYTYQVGQIHHEPFWGALVAVLSGWSPERVLQIYPFFSLVMAAGFAVSLYYGLRPIPGGRQWSGWERALVAGFATLLSSAPLEYAGTYRVPWALTFMLKPNHALGLVLLPWVIRSFALIRGWRSQLWAGFVLHLLGWVFVLHMAYVYVGLALFGALSLLEKRATARRDAVDVAATIGVSALLVSPYIIMLVVGYPILEPSARLTIPAWSPHLVEGTIRHGAVFLLGLWGAWVAYRRGDRIGRMWASILVAALLLWIAYPVLGWMKIAREMDEVYYWIRFLGAASAGIAAWDVARRIPDWLGVGAVAPAVRAAVVALIALPLSLPYWWNPLRMDSYFERSLTEVPDRVRVPTDFVLRHTPVDAVFAGELYYSRWVAALGARRVLLLALEPHAPHDVRARRELITELMTSENADAIARLAPRWGVTHLVVTRSFLEEFPGTSLDDLRARPHFELVHMFKRPKEFVAIFELRLEPK